MDSRRGTPRERGYDERWKAESRAWRFDPEHRERLYCADPFKIHRVRHVSEMVDHIVPHKGDQRLFWDKENNWQPICRRCNNIKVEFVNSVWPTLIV